MMTPSGSAAILLLAMKTYHVSIQSRGTIALPIELRRSLQLDEPGAQVSLTEQPDGSVLLEPLLPIPADQAWYWTEKWQAMEREADEEIAAGNVLVFEDAEAFLAHLESHRDG